MIWNGVESISLRVKWTLFFLLCTWWRTSIYFNWKAINMEKTRHVFYLRDTWRRQQLSPWIHLSWLGLWWDWELFVFIICMQKHLFTVTRPTSELLKSQSKQRSGNICCLYVYSLLTKLEDKKEKKEEYHQFWRIANDRKITIFRLICAKLMKNILCGEEGLKRNGIACHFGIKITSWRCLESGCSLPI